jgi:uncharacterized membrane protein
MIFRGPIVISFVRSKNLILLEEGQMASGLTVLTLVHVLLSLIGIAAGLVVLAGFLRDKRLSGSTLVFLSTTTLTSVTGYLFPFRKLLPWHILGMLSLIVVALAIIARYGRALESPWRRIYVVSSMLAFYFNVFVLLVQAFQKVPALNALAPTQSEAPFAATQLAVLVLFIVLTVLAAKRFRLEPALPA